MEWLANSGITDIKNRDYHSLWKWSVQELSSFWKSIWDYFEIMSTHPFSQILQKKSNDVFGAKWFQGSRLNYCEHAFRRLNERKISPTDEAIIGCREDGSKKVLTWQDLQNQVASFSSALHRMGVVKGDRVVAFAPNIPETIISFLATARVGAIWSSCSPDFGVPSVVDRFKQLEPKVLIATDGYSYNGKLFGKMEAIAELQSNLPTIKET
ncbi:MAG: AMP-binding protein, partial [Thaumarchaeota archaeon]|nr:AMP-binding protein [Nitrososphaerota archaeon]